MNYFYQNLREMIDYIDDNLDKEIDLKKLSLIVGVNQYTLQRIFSVISGVSLSEYIRKRRLTLAGKDIVQNKEKVMDVAIKYGYNSATSFSRAFYAFHGIKPSELKNNGSKLKFYPKLKIEIPKDEIELDYEIVDMPELKLYGLGIETDNEHIKKDAPRFFSEIIAKYPDYGHPNFGMVVYKDRFASDLYEYWVLWEKKIDDFKEWVIPKSKWLKFHIPSDEAKDIQKMSDVFYYEFLALCNYNLREMPELEYYHDGVTEFLVPIN